MTSRPAFRGIRRAGALFAATLLASTLAAAQEAERPILVLTSSNDAASNSVLVFELQTGAAPSLALAQSLPTGGSGGASGNGGIVQFGEHGGAVANFGSNTVSRLARRNDLISVEGTIALAAGCLQPDSVALAHDHLYVTGGSCAESHRWPDGAVDGNTALPDTSAAQIAAGRTWAAVTLKSGSVVALPLAPNGALRGTAAQIALPSDANNTPLGAAFWDDLLGFTPAHSADSFALIDRDSNVFPVVGPTPPYPSNAPCWVAKGRGNIWYTGNAAGDAISIFFSDAEGGVFYKSVPLPGSVTDVTVSRDGRWLAAIYSSGGSGFVATFSIDAYGDLTPVATSSAVGVAAFSGVAISQ
jgi:hypothetical protein